MGRVIGGNLRRGTYLHRDEEREKKDKGRYILVGCGMDNLPYLILSFVSLHVNEQQPVTSSSAMITKT